MRQMVKNIEEKKIGVRKFKRVKMEGGIAPQPLTQRKSRINSVAIKKEKMTQEYWGR